MNSLLDNKELFTLNQLLAGLYEDDDYQKAFTVFLERLKEIVKFQKGDVYFYRNQDGHIDFDDFIFVDWGEDYLDKYLKDYADMDDALPIVSLKQPVMFRSSDVFIPDERIKTKYYNELLLPAGMQHSIEGNIYVGDDGYVAGIGIHRPDELGDFSQKELEILKLSRPHLVNVARKFIDTRMDVDAYATGIEALYDIDEIGLCIFSKDFQVEDTNIDKGRGFIAPEFRGELLRSLVTLCKSLNEKICSNGISEDLENNKTHSRITIGHETYYAEILYKQYGNIDYKYIATVYDFKNVFDKFVYEVKSRFALTDREFEILKCALKGMSNADIGVELFISVPTVKKHLTNIYQKIGVEGKHQVLGAIL